MSSPSPGELLRARREAVGLTQKALAALAHSAQPAISRIEMGRTSPSVATLDRLLRVTGARLVLVCVDDRENPPSGGRQD